MRTPPRLRRASAGMLEGTQPPQSLHHHPRVLVSVRAGVSIRRRVEFARGSAHPAVRALWAGPGPNKPLARPPRTTESPLLRSPVPIILRRRGVHRSSSPLRCVPSAVSPPGKRAYLRFCTRFCMMGRSTHAHRHTLPGNPAGRVRAAPGGGAAQWRTRAWPEPRPRGARQSVSGARGCVSPASSSRTAVGAFWTEGCVVLASRGAAHGASEAVDQLVALGPLDPGAALFPLFSMPVVAT